MTSLIDAMLLLSRAGRQEIQFQPVALAPLVAQVHKDLTESSPDRQVVWQVAALPTIVSDPDLLRKVMTQLLDNALKFSGPREVA